MVTGYRAWSLVVQYPYTRSKQNAGRRCAIQPRCSGYWSQSHIFVENRDFSLPHLHSTFPLGSSRRNIAMSFGTEKTRMAWLSDGEIVLKISLFVSTECTNVTDGRTDRHLMLPSRGKNLSRSWTVVRETVRSTTLMGGSKSFFCSFLTTV